jgi:PAS domain S-box-containing protein
MIQQPRKLPITDEETEETVVGVLNYLDDAVITLDPYFHITSWNEAASKIHGIESSFAHGKAAIELLNYKFLNCTLEEVFENVELNGKWKGIILFRKEDQQVYLETQISRIVNKQNEFNGYIAVSRDISDSFKSRTRLKNYVSFLDALNESYIVVNADLKVVLTHFKQTVIEFYGYSFQLGDNILHKIPKHRRSVVVENCRMAFSGDTTCYKLYSSFSPELYLQITYIPLRTESGLINYVCLLIKDVSYEKMQEQINPDEVGKKTQETTSLTILEELMESSGFPAWIADREGILQYSNPAYMKYYGTGEHNAERIASLVKNEATDNEKLNFGLSPTNGTTNVNHSFSSKNNSPLKDVLVPVYFNYQDMIACWELNITDELKQYEGTMHLENEKSRMVVRSIVETQEAEREKLRGLVLSCIDEVKNKTGIIDGGTEENKDVVSLIGHLGEISDRLDASIVSEVGLSQALKNIARHENSKVDIQTDEISLEDPELELGIYRIVQAIDVLLKKNTVPERTIIQVTKVGEFIWVIINCNSHFSLIRYLDDTDWKDIDILVSFLEGNTEFNLDEIRINLPLSKRLYNPIHFNIK